MSALAGASGVRAWLQSRGWAFLTPQRLRRATIGVFVAATLVSTVGLTGSSTPDRAAASAAASASAHR